MPRTITEQRGLTEALTASRKTLQVGMESLKGFADAQGLKFEDLETDRLRWSFDDRLILEFNLTTTSVFSTDNQEYANNTISDVLTTIMRGIESYAFWHKLRYNMVEVTNVHWATYYEMVVSFA